MACRPLIGRPRLAVRDARVLADLLKRFPIINDLIAEAQRVRELVYAEKRSAYERQLQLEREWRGPRGLLEAVDTALPRRFAVLGEHRILMPAFGEDQLLVQRFVHDCLLARGVFKEPTSRVIGDSRARRQRKNARHRERMRVVRLARREAQEAREGTESEAVTDVS